MTLDAKVEGTQQRIATWQKRKNWLDLLSKTKLIQDLDATVTKKYGEIGRKHLLKSEGVKIAFTRDYSVVFFSLCVEFVVELVL